MKKIQMSVTAALLAGALVFAPGQAVTALAEETAEIEEAFEGSWCSFDGGFELYLPDAWEETEFSEEDVAASGVVYFAKAESGKVSVTISRDNSFYSVDQMLEGCLKIDEDAEKDEINGITVVTYQYKRDQKYRGIMLLGEDDLAYAVTFMTDGKKLGEDGDYIDTILASLRSAEE